MGPLAVAQGAAIRFPTLPLAIAAVLAAGCTVKGSGKGALPTWKIYVDEHPVTSAPFTLRSGDVEVQVRAVVVEEHHTAFGKSTWVNVAKAAVVNRGAGPLFPEAVKGAFRLRTRSGADHRGYVFVQGTGGWRRQEHTKEPTQLPPGATGEIRVQAEGGTETRDDPVAISFANQTVELR
jgi:hypothetical protein